MRAFPYFDTARPIAFAHRGGARLWPENTLLAFRESAALGITHIETDVHATRDDVLVCLHDDTVDRTTDGYGAIADLAFDRVRALDAGYRFEDPGGGYPFRGRDIGVPGLEEVLLASPELRFNLEIKPRGPRVPELLRRLIDRLEVHDRVLVASADEPTVRAFRRKAGGRVCTSAGRDAIIRFWSAARARMAWMLRPDFDALQVPLRQGPLTVVDRRFVEAAHAHGLHVHVWTIDDPATMKHLLALDVDGIMSDEPGVLLETLGRGRGGIV
jgi:glycerophosphoryl diester phosphodiesterase